MSKIQMEHETKIVTALLIAVAIMLGAFAFVLFGSPAYGGDHQLKLRVTIDWGESEGWVNEETGEFQDYTDRQRAATRYELQIATKETGFSGWETVTVTGDLYYDFVFSYPLCFATRVRAMGPGGDESHWTEPTMSCVEADNSTTNDYDFKRHIKYSKK